MAMLTEVEALEEEVNEVKGMEKIVGLQQGVQAELLVEAATVEGSPMENSNTVYPRTGGEDTSG